MLSKEQRLPNWLLRPGDNAQNRSAAEFLPIDGQSKKGRVADEMPKCLPSWR